MCGFVYLQGVSSQNEIDACMKRIAHRGPDCTNIIRDKNFNIGFCRLSINDPSENGMQPFSLDSRIAVINGEIYNYRELAQRFSILMKSSCDSEILLPLYKIVKDSIVDELDGFYSAVIIEDDSLVCLRDEMGQKPLFYGKTDAYFFIVSELKAVKGIQWFKEVSPGITKIYKKDFSLKEYKEIKPKCSTKSILNTLNDAVKKRIPLDGSEFGIFLSGGLDSSIVASLAINQTTNIHFFSLADSKSPDFTAIEQIVKYLNISNHHLVKLPTKEELKNLIQKIVYYTESFNPSIISNGLATYLLAQEAHKYGLKVILSGEGSDELFGGYRNFKSDEDWQTFRKMLIQDMHYTELRRLDLCCMANSIESRCPFLDRDVLAISNTLNYNDLFKDEIGKRCLKESFKSLLPEQILNRKKVSCDVGSGIRKMVVNYLKSNGLTERESLKKIWARFNFGLEDQTYFSKYPAFDEWIDKRESFHC